MIADCGDLIRSVKPWAHRHDPMIVISVHASGSPAIIEHKYLAYSPVEKNLLYVLASECEILSKK